MKQSPSVSKAQTKAFMLATKEIVFFSLMIPFMFLSNLLGVAEKLSFSQPALTPVEFWLFLDQDWHIQAAKRASETPNSVSTLEMNKNGKQASWFTGPSDL